MFSSSPPVVIILSISSDIGLALAKAWVARGWRVIGTYRQKHKEIEELENIPLVTLFQTDLISSESIANTCKKISAEIGGWDSIVSAAGELSPIGNFATTPFEEWHKNLQVNLIGQLEFIHHLLPLRNAPSKLPFPTVLFFAGSGTNGIAPKYSAYTVSKIALIKMCELLANELPEIRFTILGPGIVHTKIHTPTFNLSHEDPSYQKVKSAIGSSKTTPMSDIIDCCTWLLTSPSEGLTGRNFSVVYDAWGTDRLTQKLVDDHDMYKLRRNGNDWK